MRIALVQQRATSDRQANVQRGLEALQAAAANGAERLYAELAFEPFYPQRPAGPDFRDLAEPVPGPITEAFQAEAAGLGVVVVLNLFERDGSRTFDTSPVIDADGRLLGRTRIIHITSTPASTSRATTRRVTPAPRSTTRRSAGWAWPSATTATSPNTCARWAWQARNW